MNHTLNSLLFAPDDYPTATEDQGEIEETAMSGTVEGSGTRIGRERRALGLPYGGGPTLPIKKN